MSSAPTDCRVPDPTDARADGGFGNHRAGYAQDRLAEAEHWARKGGTLAAGEGLVLCREIDRLQQQCDLLDGILAERNRVLNHAVELLDALREPSEELVTAAIQVLYGNQPDLIADPAVRFKVVRTIQEAVALAEIEVPYGSR